MSSDPIGDFLFGGSDGGGGALSALGDAGNWVASQISPNAILSNLSGGDKGGGGGSTPAAADPTAAAATDPTAAAASPYAGANPLAMQLYFTQNIAPLLSQIMDKSNAQSKDFLNMAQQGMQNLHLPAQYQGIFQSMLPRQQAAHNDVMASLAGAAVSGPALDSLQKQIAQATSQATKDYYSNEALRAAGTTTSAIPSAADIAAELGTKTP